MIAETVHRHVPQRREHFDEERLSEGYPNVVNREVAAGEVLQFQVLRLFYGLRVFRQTFEEDTPCRNIQSKAALPRAF